MTTNNHLNEFTEIDPKILDDLKNTADELLPVKNLDLDNTEYLAKVLFFLGRYDESIMQFERVLSIKSDDEKAMTFIAICHFKKGDYKAAIEHLSKSLEKDPENEWALTYKMLSHEFLKDYRNAVICAEQILKTNPKNTSVINRLIDYHFELKNYDICLAYIRQIEYKNPYRKALILYESGRYEESIEEASKIRTAESYHLAGKSHHKLGNITKAARYLFKSYEIDQNVDTLFEISEIYFEDDDPKKSIYYLKEVLLNDDENAEALSKIALAYVKSGDWHDAAEYAKKALEINRKMSQAYITMAEAYVQLDRGRSENAKDIVEEGLRENPESAKLWAQKGYLDFTDDSLEFISSYEKAIRLNPNDYDIYSEFINLLLMVEDVERAKIYYNRLLLLNPLFEKSFREIHDFWSCL